MAAPLLGEACALGAALCWSTSLILFKRSEAVSPLGMNLFKNVAATALLGVTMIALGVPVDLDRSPAEWAALCVSGVLGIAIADTLTLSALRVLGAGLLAVVDCAYAPVVVVLSMGWLGERPNGGFAVGAALVVAGVLVASSESAGSGARPAGARRGIALGVTGIAVMGVGVMLAKPALERGNLLEVTLVRLVAGVVAQAIWIACVPSAREALGVLRPSRAWRTLAPASVLGSYAAMLLWLGGFKWAPASRAAVLNQISTVFTIVMARLILRERVSTRRALGATAALIGAIAVVALR